MYGELAGGPVSVRRRHSHRRCCLARRSSQRAQQQDRRLAGENCTPTLPSSGLGTRCAEFLFPRQPPALHSLLTSAIGPKAQPQRVLHRKWQNPRGGPGIDMDEICLAGLRPPLHTLVSPYMRTSYMTGYVERVLYRGQVRARANIPGSGTRLGANAVHPSCWSVAPLSSPAWHSMLLFPLSNKPRPVPVTSGTSLWSVRPCRFNVLGPSRCPASPHPCDFPLSSFRDTHDAAKQQGCSSDDTGTRRPASPFLPGIDDPWPADPLVCERGRGDSKCPWISPAA